MIPEHEYIVAHGMKMVTMELVENYHGPVAITSFLGSMAGKTCVMLNNTNYDWSKLIGYYARDYEQWLDEIWIGSHFVVPRPRTHHSEPTNKCGYHCPDNPTDPKETPDPACVIVEGNVLIVVLACL